MIIRKMSIIRMNYIKCIIHDQRFGAKILHKKVRKSRHCQIYDESA